MPSPNRRRLAAQLQNITMLALHLAQAERQNTDIEVLLVKMGLFKLELAKTFVTAKTIREERND